MTLKRGASAFCCLGALLLAVVLLNATVVVSYGGFVYDDHGKRDPLWPLVSPGGSVRYYDTKVGVEDMRLEGTMLGNENLAIVNGKVVKVDDKVAGFTVKQIEENKVVLDKEGKTFELILKTENK